ncbi:hypothetical protein GF322_03545 [Candidatus Dependentiae bacterium]|nr:hypothetical protein [Candidatus Dependentiae bacterium]
MTLNKKIHLTFMFIILTCISYIFCKKKLEFPKNLNLLELKNYKYVIFDGCKTFWEKSLYDLLYSYQKKRGLSWSDYIKLTKFGLSYLLGTLDIKKAYEEFLIHCKGINKKDAITISSKVWQDECKNFIYQDAKKIFDFCKKNKIITILTEAGFEEFYLDFLKTYTFDYICTSKIKYKDEKISGQLEGMPCSGHEKTIQIKKIIEDKLKGSLKEAVFFANSHNDIDLLNLVGKPIAVNPDNKLKKYASSKKWEILKFNKIHKI